MEIRAALLGNPNTGKTSLFNNLTGSYEYVGNWSGVTVEKKQGVLLNKNGYLVDLPGVYSLQPLSKDEGVVTEYLLTEEFTQLVNIVDASQLRRNLHLTLQLLEFGKPMIIGLNMVDVAKRRGTHIDIELLAKSLGVQVVPVIARTGEGCKELSEKISVLTQDSKYSFHLDYGEIIESAINKITEKLTFTTHLPKRWLAIQYLEGNNNVVDFITQQITHQEFKQIIADTEALLMEQEKISTIYAFIKQVRQMKIDDLLQGAMNQNMLKQIPFSEKIDRILTNKYVGMPIFLCFMYLMFMITFDWLGLPLSDVLDGFISGSLSEWIANVLQLIGASTFIERLILEGIVAGVGGVLVFVPQIFILFLFISFMEDSGYMARVAMVMDRMMESIGLNGKAFIPMIIGFGCNVPGIMAARTIEQPKDRLLTILLTPFMSCSARLPVYAVFVGAFFAQSQALIVFSLYVLGVIVAFIIGRLFSALLLKNESSFFVIELPPYRIPHVKTLWRSTWDKGKGFISKAGTFIFAGSVLIWLISYIGPGGTGVEVHESYLAKIGGMIVPIIEPLGFGSWQIGAALITGFFAKEVVVSTMNIIYFAPNTESLQTLIQQSFSTLAAYSFMVFVLLYIPCLATTATIFKETKSKRWTCFAVLYSLAVAYTLSFVIFHVGKLFGLA